MLSALRPTASLRFWLRPLLLLLLLLASAGAVFAQSGVAISNAGFETPNIGSGGGAYTATPSGASWTFVNGGGISGNNSGFTSQNSSAPEGSQVAFIQITGSISQSLTGFQAGTTYTLTVSAAQRVAYSGGTQVVQVSMDGTALGKITPSGAGYTDYSFSYTPQTSGAHTLQFLGLNPQGGDNTVFLDNVRFSATSTASSPTQVLAINAGGGAVGSFAADADYDTGNTYTVSTAIDTSGVTNPAPQAVYQSERWGNFTYTLPGLTPGASYTLRLHFAETSVTGAGQRIFSVAVNGNQVLTNFDIFAAAGGANKAVAESFPAVANGSGQIVVQFVQGAQNNPKVDGLEVLSAGTGGSVTPIPVPGLFPTGVDGSGNQLADGAADPHYAILSGPDGAGAAAQVTLSNQYPFGYWTGDSATSKWVSPQANQSSSPEPPGSYVYETTFSLANFDPASVQVTGQVMVDDQITDVQLNGKSLGITASSFTSWTPLSITSGFQAGVNTLEFLVLNGGSSNNPSGFRAELSGTGKAVSTAPTASGEVHFYPRAGLASRMVGGKFQGSSDGSAYTDLYTIATQPTDGQWTTATLTTDPKNYRYLRYLSPDGDYGNIAELAFYTGTGTSAVKLTGTPFGTPGSWQNQGNDFAKVFDGDTTTYFDAPDPGNGDFAGIDQGAPTTSVTPASIAVSPASQTLNTGGTQQFTAVAKDQSGNALSPQPAFIWSVASGGVGTISSSGLYSAGSAAGSATVQATSGVSGSASVTVAAPAPSQPTPYSGSPIAVTSSGTTTVEAENYDLGGEGIAYHDVDNGGSTLYRSDNVGIDSIASASNGYGVGNTAGGEWDGYTISIASAGTYTLSASVSSPAPGGTFHLEFGLVGQVGGSGIIQSGEFTVPNTGSYTSFQSVSVPGVSLPAGRLWMRLVLDSAYPCIFDYFTLSPASTGPAVPTGLTATAGNASVALSWTAPSGSGLTYNVKRATVSGGPYISVGGSSGTSYPDTGLTNGTTYYYVVTAVSSAGESGNSNEATATPSGPAADFTVAASPNNFGITPGGTASTVVTITPSSTFSGSVALSVSGLPPGITASFNPSSVSVTAGVAAASTLTLTSSSSAPAATLKVTATSGALSRTAPLTLTTVSSATTGLVDLYFDPVSGALANKVAWGTYSIPPGNTFQYYFWTRNQAAPTSVGVGNRTTNNGADPFLIDNDGVTYGTRNTYRAYVDYSYYASDDGGKTYYIVSKDILLLTCSATDLQSFATDNQAVDSRLDPRYSTNTFLNHQFGSTVYRGGLFAGFNNDPARVGRSLIKFAMPAVPSGQSPWPVGSVLAYALRAYTPGTTTTVSCQRVSDGWTGPTATWSLAPAMTSASNGQAVVDNGTSPINTWIRWPLGTDIAAALLSNGGTLSVGLSSTNESSQSWAYFAKKEYDPALTPFVLYSYGGFQLMKMRTSRARVLPAALGLGALAVGGGWLLWTGHHPVKLGPKMVYVASGYGGFVPAPRPAVKGAAGTQRGAGKPRRIKPADPVQPLREAYNAGQYPAVEAAALRLVSAAQTSKSRSVQEQGAAAGSLLAYAAARRHDLKLAQQRFTAAQAEAARLPDKGKQASLPGQVSPTLEEDAAFQHAVCTNALGDPNGAEKEYVAWMQRYPESPLRNAVVLRLEKLHGGNLTAAEEAVRKQAGMAAQARQEGRAREASLCGPECLAELLRRRGEAGVSVHRLADAMHTSDRGTTLGALAQAAQRHGFSARGFGFDAARLGRAEIAGDRAGGAGPLCAGG